MATTTAGTSPAFGIPAGVYFTHASIGGELFDSLIRIKFTAVLSIGGHVIRKEFTVTGADVLTAVQAMLALLGGIAGAAGVPLDSRLAPVVPH